MVGWVIKGITNHVDPDQTVLLRKPVCPKMWDHYGRNNCNQNATLTCDITDTTLHFVDISVFILCVSIVLPDILSILLTDFMYRTQTLYTIMIKIKDMKMFCFHVKYNFVCKIIC